MKYSNVKVVVLIKRMFTIEIDELSRKGRSYNDIDEGDG
jgi:hypothetical protein